MNRIAARSQEVLDEQGPSGIGFYTSGQLFLEEYYTLGIIAHAAIGTNHVDGNTRLCTATAAEALKESFGCDGQPGRRGCAIHLAPLPGTNVALMNGLLHEVIEHNWVDHAWIAAHTVGFDELAKQVAAYTPEKVATICDVPADDLRAAARLIGTTDRLLSSVLQGFYQSHQATAAAVQVNNLHLVRGMLGRPGCGVSR